LALAQASWLFRGQGEFAQLVLTPLTAQNASATFALASRVLHYSPEPRVIELAIESAELSGLPDQAAWHRARYAAAFPGEFAAWQARHTTGGSAAPERAKLPQ
jgi:hypothetical protein